MFMFGSMLYTEDDIRQIGFAHGQDGIGYYPPSSWGPYSSEPRIIRIDRMMMTVPDTRYQESYKEGFYSIHDSKGNRK